MPMKLKFSLVVPCKGKLLTEAMDGNSTPCPGLLFDGTVGLISLKAIAQAIHTTGLTRLFFWDTELGDLYPQDSRFETT
jgi:hypothetical protein